jgi:hypothetical protein
MCLTLSRLCQLPSGDDASVFLTFRVPAGVLVQYPLDVSTYSTAQSPAISTGAAVPTRAGWGLPDASVHAADRTMAGE